MNIIFKTTIIIFIKLEKLIYNTNLKKIFI